MAESADAPDLIGYRVRRIDSMMPLPFQTERAVIKNNIQPKQSPHRTGAQIPEVADKKANVVVANKKRIRYTHGRG